MGWYAMSKKIMLSIAAIAAIIALSFAVVGIDYVRWNTQMEECVYYYDKSDDARAHCFVAEKNCEEKDGQNHEKSIDPVECSSEPLNPQNQVHATGDCAEFVEGDKIVLKYQGSDPDNDDLDYLFEAPFDNEENAWQTERGDAGHYEVEVSVTDGEYSDTAIVCFDVLPGNKAPVLSVDDVTGREGETLTLDVACNDPDGDAVRIAYSGDFESGVISADYDSAGTYTVIVTCTDTEGASDQESVSVTIEDVNRAPRLTGVEDVTVMETETVDLNPRCVDPEGEETTIAYSGAMTTDMWKTSYADAGEYDVTITCADESGLSTSEELTITVKEKNRAPMITAFVTAE